jgi:hypothetical protein
MFNHTVEFINNGALLNSMLERLDVATAIALDIETINWWDREAERVSLVQLAFREGDITRVMIIDALAGFDLEALRQPLELSLKMKAIHNASYDAVRIARHFRIKTSPIYDTMLAARRSGERRCSLQAQVEAHLGLQLDKSEQRGDWSRRPLSEEQLTYASLDAACTLLLYEKQTERGLHGDYELREKGDQRQASLPLAGGELRIPSPPSSEEKTITNDLNNSAFALLGIITELNGRYSPEQLAVSVGAERVGLAGWIIDRLLGSDADIDEDNARQEIATLCELGLIQISRSRRLEPTSRGAQLWQQEKRRSLHAEF